MKSHRPTPRSHRTVVAAAAALGLLSGCATAAPTDTPASAGPGAPATSASTDAVVTSDITEAPAVRPRLVLSHDGGAVVLDASSLEPVGSVPLDGFVRLSPAGDGRHAVVSTTGGFQLLDSGTWGEVHGDHAHYFNAAPVLTDVVFPAQKPGHVVVHAGRTVLFDDGTGAVLAVDSSTVASGTSAGNARAFSTPNVHHGVAVELADGTVLVTEGDAEQRSGVRALDEAGREIAESAQCPGVHGEATAADETVVFGCTDGALVYADGTFIKVSSPDDDGRLGTLVGSSASGVVLADYASESRAEAAGAASGGSHIALVDTTAATMRVVELPAGYTFRSLGRGAHGEALVLGTDGNLHVIDPTTGVLTNSIAVVEPWEAPEDWQQPRPTLLVFDGSAYVTDPAARALHAVDVETSRVWRSGSLGLVPNEIVGISGEAPVARGEGTAADQEHSDEGHSDEGDSEEGHSEEGHSDDEHRDDEHDDAHDGHDH